MRETMLVHPPMLFQIQEHKEGKGGFISAISPPWGNLDSCNIETMPIQKLCFKALKSPYSVYVCHVIIRVKVSTTKVRKGQ